MKRQAGEIAAAATTNGSAAEPQTLSSYIQSRFDECSRSQKDVAQYIIDHLDEAAFQTAEELARRANTSSSTVVRFSQALGFVGFPELQRAAREEYKRAHGAAEASSPLFAIERTEFALVLSDIRMPSMNGVQFLEWLTAHRPDLLPKTVFMTGDGRSSELNAHIERAGQPVLRKPFTLDALVRMTTGILTPS